MKFLTLIVTFALLVPTANAAVLSSTKQKKLPTIDNVRVGSQLNGYGFDIVKATTTDAYDVWGRLTNTRKKIVNEWFVGSMKFRRKNVKVNGANFQGNIGDFLRYENEGTYELTLFACPANIRKPTENACASAKKAITFPPTK